MSNDLTDDLQTSFTLLSAEQIGNSQSIINNIIGIFKEESMFVIGILSKIANSFDAKDFDDDIIGREIFIEKVVILIFSINCIDFILVVESLVEIFYDVLNHHAFQLALLLYQLNYIFERGTLVLWTHEFVGFDVVQADMQNLFLQLKVALLYQFGISQNVLFESGVDAVEVLEVVKADCL